MQIGEGKQLKAWEQGLLGLCEGARATLVVPPQFSHGSDGDGKAIPGGATLNFDVEVIRVTETSTMSRNLFKLLDLDSSGTITRSEVLP